MFACDIDINNTISNLTIEGMINLIANNEPGANKFYTIHDNLNTKISYTQMVAGPLYIPVVTIPSILILLLLFILIIVVVLSVALYKLNQIQRVLCI